MSALETDKRDAPHQKSAPASPRLWIERARSLPRAQVETVVIVAVGILLALALRYALRGYVSYDYTFFMGTWYKEIKRNGFSAFASSFANYTPAYLYLLFAVSLVFRRLSGVTAVKLPSIAFDFIGAWAASAIVRLQYNKGPAPLLAFFAVLFAPTIFINSSLWGQSDIIYTTFLLGFLYFVLVRRPALAMVCFSISFAFKFQTIFVAPLLLALLLRRAIPWWQLVFIPAVYLVTIFPAVLAGRPLVELLTVYIGQADLYRELTLAAPNPYNWMSDTYYNQLYPAGLVLGAAAGFAYAVAVYKSRAPLTPALVIELALVSAILMPYVLPKMHERYFFPADVLAILFAFFIPRRFWVALAMSMISFFSYTVYLFGRDVIPQPLLAILLGGLLVFLVWDTLGRLYFHSADLTQAVPPGNNETVLDRK
jgi:Gpi18-like mannosyltransferase